MNRRAVIGAEPDAYTPLSVPRLIIHQRGGLRISVALTQAMTLGRDATSDIALSDSKVSREHARIELAEGVWRIVDGSSQHGTFVNGERVDSAPLADGDQVQLGETLVFFEAREAPAEVLSTLTTDPDARSGLPPQLSLFYQLADAARSIEDRDQLLQQTLEGVIAAVGADRGMIAIAAAGSGSLQRVAELDSDDVVIGRELIAAALERNESSLVSEEGYESLGTTLKAQGVRTAMVAPLGIGPGGRGLIYVDAAELRFDHGDLELLGAIAALVSSIAGAAGKYELAAAHAEVAKRSQKTPTLVGTSEAILALRRDIERLGPTDLPVHITGASGVGKELVARALHAGSERHRYPLVAVNCAALAENLIESELFGHARGAFTGAASAHRGKFVLADRGTLFLDEIADLSLAAQAKVLRVIEDGQVHAVGSERPKLVDIRVLSASHKDLRREVASGRFREDLYYRLVVAEIVVPPLRERGDDINTLAELFLQTCRVRSGERTLSTEARAALARHDWPGNVRELRNVIERAVALARGGQIELADLRLRPLSSTHQRDGLSLQAKYADLDATEKRLVERALRDADGNVTAAARLLGISRVMMKRRIERFGLG